MVAVLPSKANLHGSRFGFIGQRLRAAPQVLAMNLLRSCAREMKNYTSLRKGSRSTSEHIDP
jgi:hypothetical protein